MRKSIGWLIVILILIGATVSLLLWRRTMTQPQLSQPLEVPHVPVAPVSPTIHYPVLAATGSQAATEPLPAMEDSDHALLDALSALLGPKVVASFFYPELIVRHIVVTIDNLPRAVIAVQLDPVKPVGGKFLVKREDQTLSIAPENAERYVPYVRIAQMVEPRKLVALYLHFYPMFQRAYQDLGYPNGYFNDRLIEVIDHLIDGPEASAPLRLVQPHVSYRFADQELETMSTGRKILMRIGAENAAKIKEKLREIRRELTDR